MPTLTYEHFQGVIIQDLGLKRIDIRSFTEAGSLCFYDIEPGEFDIHMNANTKLVTVRLTHRQTREDRRFLQKSTPQMGTSPQMTLCVGAGVKVHINKEYLARPYRKSQNCVYVTGTLTIESF